MGRKKGSRNHPDRLIVDDFGTAKLYHHCSRCRGWLEPHMGNFTPLRRHTETRQVLAWDFYCRPCRNAYRREWWASLSPEERTVESRKRRDYSKRAAPEILEERRERHRRKQAKYRALHPERHADAQRRYRSKIMADPKLHAAMLERDRINYRLKAEREGRELSPRRVKSAVNAYRELKGRTGDRTLPAKPFREWLTTILGHEGVRHTDVHRPEVERDGWAMTDLGRRLNLDESTVRKIIRNVQSEVTMTTADRALTSYGRPVSVSGYGPVTFLWDLWPELAT